MCVEARFERVTFIFVLSPSCDCDQTDIHTATLLSDSFGSRVAVQLGASRRPVAPHRGETSGQRKPQRTRRTRFAPRSRPLIATSTDCPLHRGCRLQSTRAPSRRGGCCRFNFRRRFALGGCCFKWQPDYKLTPPTWAALWASTVPPCSSIRPLTRARPMPRPPSERPIAEGLCENIVKRRSSCSAVIPMPSSLTAITSRYAQAYSQARLFDAAARGTSDTR